MFGAEKLIEKFKYALEDGWGYIWGQWGAEWTAAKQKQKVNYMIANFGSGWKDSAAAKENKYYSSARYGDKWIGKRVADCSGLFRWAFDQLGGAITHSSNGIWEGYCTKKGKLLNGVRDDGLRLKPGTAVFVHPAGKNRTHIGLYSGDGLVIEASGTQTGVIRSSVTHKKWVEWGELKGVNYYDGGDEPMPDTKPMLRKGDKGEYVKLAQEKLKEKGYDIGKWGVDGSFGSATEEAVKRFQKAEGLKQDGIIGPDTWEKLLEDKPVTILYTVCIPNLTKEQAEELKAKYAGASVIGEGR